MIQLLNELRHFRALVLDDNFFNLPPEFWCQPSILATTTLSVECNDFAAPSKHPYLEQLLSWVYHNNNNSNAADQEQGSTFAVRKQLALLTVNERRILEIRPKPLAGIQRTMKFILPEQKVINELSINAKLHGLSRDYFIGIKV